MLQIGKSKAQIKPIACVISLSSTIRNLTLETKNLLNLILLVPKRKMTCTQAEMLEQEFFHLKEIFVGRATSFG